jgi:hypothetical protein
MNDPRLRARAALEPVTPLLREGFRKVLATPFEQLNLPWEVAEFEVDPMFFGITAIPLDDAIVPCIIPDLIPVDVIDDEATSKVFGDVVMEWMADTWREAGGEEFPYPGQGFFHDYPERYDFRTRQWLPD